MNAPDWSLLSPAHKDRWEKLLRDLDDERRRQSIDDLRFLKEMRRSIMRDAALNDVEPQGIEQLEETIALLLERLT